MITGLRHPLSLCYFSFYMCVYICIYVCVCVRMCLSGKAESCNGSVVKFIVQEEAVHSKELLPSAFIASLLY